MEAQNGFIKDITTINQGGLKKVKGTTVYDNVNDNP